MLERVTTRLAVAVIVAATLVVLVPSLFTRDPWNPDEPRAAEVAREMVALGDYLVPHLNGLPYSNKPPVFYWLASIFWKSGAGVNSGRLVSLLATVGMGLAIYALGRRLHSPALGLLAALFTLSTLLTAMICRFGVLDPLLSLFTTLSVYCAVRAFEGGGTLGRWWLAAYAAAGLAFLTKGPVGVAVPFLVSAAYGWLRRREVAKGGWWHLAGAALLVGMVAAWLAPACIHGGKAYTHNILFQQTAQRVGEGASHGEPFYFYLTQSPFYFSPWALILVLGLVWAVRVARAQRDPAALLAVAWFIAVFVFFSLFSGKRERYLLPLMPALGLLCGRYALAVIKGQLAPLRWHHALWRITFVFIGIYAVGLIVLALAPDAVAKRFTTDSGVLAEMKRLMTPGVLAGAVLTGIAMLAACFYGIRLPRGGAGEGRRLIATLAAMLALSLGIDLCGTPIIDQFKSGRHLIERAGLYLKDAEEVYLYQSNFAGVYNLFSGRVRMPELDAEADLKAALESGRKVTVIVKEGLTESLRGKMPFHEVAQEQVGHRKISVITNWKP